MPKFVGAQTMIIDPNGTYGIYGYNSLFYSGTKLFLSKSTHYIEILNITQLIAIWKEIVEINPVENHESWMNES